MNARAYYNEYDAYAAHAGLSPRRAADAIREIHEAKEALGRLEGDLRPVAAGTCQGAA